VQPFAEQLLRLERENAGPRCPACREELALFRRMEEFRVSVFAPEVGTVMPVSEKRQKAEEGGVRGKLLALISFHQGDAACYRL
jgi:anti-sigma factor RsiW